MRAPRRRVDQPVVPVDEGQLVRVARILGPCSAAQQALDDAGRHRAQGQEVIFAQAGQILLVIDERAIESAR